ncbi:uncharacterized protein LOC129227675 [Uloborus diversus]|uniref:uncharacterized protein LOC129227675 n=1 Tax=Uloborus diversus TaxID=327109 RepID=UPI002409A66C|nr:uncharacterized protein LOC129227675 [Uloborus diversus]
MMSKKDTLELPGFDRDPVTGKYYRKLPAGSPSCFDVRRHPNSPEDNSAEKLKIPNVAKLISQRDLGQLVNTKFETDILELKTKDIFLKKKFTFPGDVINELALMDCQFLKRGNGTIIGKWSCKNFPNMCYLGEFEDDVTNLHKKSDPLLHAYLVKKFITDFCECYDSQYRYVVFSAHRNCDNVGLIYLINTQICADRSEFASITYLDLNIVSPIWCCASNHQKLNFAVGLEKFVNVYSSTRIIRSIGVPGQAHTVEFDKTGNLMFSGLNNGRLIMSDLRTRREHDVSVKLSDCCLQEIKLSSGENYIIYGDFAGRINRVDFRMDLNCVAEYKGHYGSKPSFSFSENFNVLCANGQDNVTRLWSLEHGGKPLRYIETEKGCSSSSIISDNGSKCVIYHVVNDLVNAYGF